MKIENEIIRICAQACVNTYEGRHGEVRKCFDKATVHKLGKITWHEGYRQGKLFIVFEGTHNKAGWEDNFDYQQVPTGIAPARVKVHKGFWRDEFAFVSSDIYDAIKGFTGPVIFTGHSLGGALCILAAWFFAQLNRKGGLCGKIQVVSIAGPRVGNHWFSYHYRRLHIPTVLFRYKFDPVTQVPPRVVPGLVERGIKFLWFDFWPSILFYGRVKGLTHLGFRNPISFLLTLKRNAKEMKMLYHNPEDYRKAINKRYK